MNYIEKPCLVLTILGALNWGLVAIFNFDLVRWITGNEINIWTRIIYSVIAIAGIINILLLFARFSLDKDIEERLSMNKSRNVNK